MGTLQTKNNKRYLVVASVGDKSLHRQWLKPLAYKNFDLCLHYYGNIPGRYANQCDYYFESKGDKWLKLKSIYHSLGEKKLSQYDAIWLPDDNISTDAKNISRMFEIFNEQGFKLAHPALTKQSHHNYKATALNTAFRWRYCHFAESIAPLFSIDAFQTCLPSFEENTNNSSIETPWPKLLGEPNKKIAIIDETPVTHIKTFSKDSMQVNRERSFHNKQQSYPIDLPIYHLSHYDGVPKNHKLIIALLAHKNKNILRQQIKNIRFFNPNAGIVLYNGGSNKNLAKNLDVAECPYSRPLKWARQTRVLLDISKWLEEADVDYEYLVCFDHDALFIKHGFEEFLDKEMKNLDCMGWRLRITSKGDELPPSHTTSIKKELHIWTSIFGTDNLHYYFNNGQVYRRSIIRKILSSIDYAEVTPLIDKTEVFALEEMFFITLAASCGGRIGEYPNGHDYNDAVHHSKNINMTQFNSLKQDNYFYWIHPVKGDRLLKVNKKLLPKNQKRPKPRNLNKRNK